MSNKGTVAVIGGGVAGLSAGAFLARHGFDVHLFEAKEKIGGCCATTEVDGYTFNDGAIYLALPGVLDHVFMKLGLERATLLPLRRITAPQTTILPDGSTVRLGDDLDLTVERPCGAPDKGVLQQELRQALAKWEPVLRLFTDELLLHPFSYGRLLRKGWCHLPKLRGSVAAEIRALFSDRAVQAALSGVVLFAGLPPEKTPVLSLLGLIALLAEGFYLPEGGMGKIPATLACGLARHGGTIHLNSAVRRIVLRNGRVAGLEVEGQGEVAVEAVISTVSGMLTGEQLLAPEDVPEKMRRRVAQAPLSHKVLCLQLGLANQIDVDSHSVNILPWLEEQGRLFEPQDAEVRWPVFFVPTVTMPELAPAGGSIVEMYLPGRRDVPVAEWDEERRRRVVAGALEALGSRYQLDIAAQRVLTPRDYQERMHLYQGAVYGLTPTADPRSQFPHKTPVRGLFQAGQTTYPGYGVGAAAMSGIFAAEALLKAPQVARR